MDRLRSKQERIDEWLSIARQQRDQAAALRKTAEDAAKVLEAAAWREELMAHTLTIHIAAEDLTKRVRDGK